MLRLPAFRLLRPATLAEALAMLAEHGPRAVVMAGGTDLLPNMKHELVTPGVVIALGGIPELTGIRDRGDGGLSIGAMTTLDEVAKTPAVGRRAPALAQAASLVAGPQLRRMGTIGGNVLLDTRCQWYNQTYFWRSSIGFCLKKDGTQCHVVEGGSQCVAAASNDTAPALMTLGASLEVANQEGRRLIPIDDLWVPDGIRNTRLGAGDLLLSINIPPSPGAHRGAYGKLRDRGSIDFPLLGVAARLDLDAAGIVTAADLVLTALAATPRRVKAAAELLVGSQPGTAGFEARTVQAAEAAYRQCHTLANIPGDAPWRREMIRVYVRRTLLAAAAGTGPVHHV